MDEEEKAFVIASCEVRIQNEKDEAKKAKRKKK